MGLLLILLKHLLLYNRQSYINLTYLNINQLYHFGNNQNLPNGVSKKKTILGNNIVELPKYVFIFFKLYNSIFSFK